MSCQNKTKNFLLFFILLLILSSFIKIFQTLNEKKKKEELLSHKKLISQNLSNPIKNKKNFFTKNDFLFIDQNCVWLAKINDNYSKPVIKKLINGSTNYSISHSKDKVVYVSNNYLKIKKLFSGEEKTLQKLTPDSFSEKEINPDYFSAINNNFAWSSDDTKLAFVGINDNQPDIYVIDIDGKNLKRITNDKLIEFSLIWSPDNKKIAFQTTESFGTGVGFHSTIAVVNENGKNYSQVAVNGKLLNNHEFNFAENLRWINNNELIFIAFHPLGTNGIWKININTKQITPLTEKFGEINPMWSEKNKSFLYPLKNKDIQIVGINGKTKTIETNGKVNKAIWSYDETKILFDVKTGLNKYDIFIADSDGNNQKKIILNGDFFIENFSITSDNKSLLLLKRFFKPDFHTELWLINLDTKQTNQKKLDDALDLNGPYTTPNGNFVIFSKLSSYNKNQYINYWLNLNDLSKAVILYSSEPIYPKFLNYL